MNRYMTLAAEVMFVSGFFLVTLLRVKMDQIHDSSIHAKEDSRRISQLTQTHGRTV